MKKERVLFWIVTGMSGAGKSQTIHCFEDFGFFCVDNIPVSLLPKMADLCAQSGNQLQRVAVGIGVNCKIVFLDADDRGLLRRFSETRRRHPLGTNVQQGIKEERRRLLKIKELADKIIDTTNLNLSDLKQRIVELLDHRSDHHRMQLSLLSFGYKYGLPVDADLVWDVRFMTNPNYQPNLKEKTGRDLAVRRFVLGTTQAKRLGKKFFDLVVESLPHYIREGKSYLTIAIGCTGGRHRSVVMAESLADHLAARGYKIRVHHRDIER
jgi:UPF0042 nucleotide-binding protein